MAKTEDKTNKLYGTGSGENNVTPITENKINIGNKLATLNPNDPTQLIDAFNIDWASGQYSYDGNPNHIIQSTGHLIEVINSKATTSSFDDFTDSFTRNSQVILYNTTASKTSYPTKIEDSIEWADNIFVNSIGDPDITYGWRYNIKDTESNPYVWMASMTYTETFSNNAWEIGNFHDMSSYILLSGESGINGNFKSTVFVRTNSTPLAPKSGAVYDTGLPTNRSVYVRFNPDISIMGKQWSDGIPSGQEILWASTAIISAENPSAAQWTTPRQMTDTDTYDVEFSSYDTPGTPDTNPSYWVDPGTKHYRDHTSQNSHIYDGDFSEMIWRAEREIQNGSPVGDWVITRIKGENGEVGIQGPFKSTVFTRTSKDISLLNISEEVTPGSYNEYYHPVPPPSSYQGETIVWSDGTPSGEGALWSAWKTFDLGGNNSDWSYPQLMADTDTYDVEFSPSTSTPAEPSINNRHKSNSPYEGQVWFDPILDANNVDWSTMIWRAERTKEPGGEWGTWVITKIKGENGTQGKPADYYEQRWTITDDIQTPDTPSNAEIGIDDNVWKLTPQYEAGKITWLTSRKVIYRGNPGEYEAIYDGEWSTPMRMTGTDGVSNPIQPVLKYYWHTDYSTAPSCNTSEQIPNVNGETIWAESPGNPHDSYIYLWMIQGQRHEGQMIDLDNSSAVSYWTAPVCLSGKNGEPGVDGSDIEFIYKRFTNVHEFTNDNPASWYTSSSINKPTEEWTGGGNNYSFAYVNSYLGPVEQGWTDHPQGITNVYKYEYATYRKTHDINGESYWGVFNTPFAWSVYGENGLDGDGVEYIYTTTVSNTQPTAPQITNSNYEASQQSEWGVGQPNGININDTVWHDDPQQVNNEYQKFQWVSTRKYRYPKTNETTLGEHTLDHNKKYWFDYTTPQLWNWYVNDGTNAKQISIIYNRTSSYSDAPALPGVVYINSSYQSNINVGSAGGENNSNKWFTSPGNNTSYNGDEYLWMTSIKYSNYKDISQFIPGGGTKTTRTFYNTDSSWQTPVCLTGEPGNDGADGTDIEFIYFRTGEDNVTFNNGWDNFAGDSTQADWPFVGTEGTDYYIIDGVKTLLSQDHDTWSDNPFGVTSTYDYEYASIRKKINGTWGDFCKPFLWSKYGEDGVDGDGVEYIYYCPETTTLIDWTNSNYNNINPSLWDATTSDFQASEYYVSPWTDDPQEVGENYKYEYVSQRKKRKITDSNKSNFDSTWTTGNSFTKNEQTYNIGDMAWFPYSVPALWANYAKDGLATNLVLESDNDNVTVGIDSNGLVNNNYQDTTTFRLVYNTHPLTLSSDYTLNMFNPDNNLFDLSNNILSFKSSSDFSGTFAVLNGNTLTISVPEGFDMNEYDNILPITFTATIINNSINGLDYNTTAVFTLKITAVELTLNDIYKLNINKLVVTPNANNDGYETLNISLKSLTSTNSITTKNDADNNNLKVYYRPYRLKTGEDTSGQNNQVTNFSNVLLNFSYIKHEFELKYNNGSNEISLDIETVSAVFDGEKGNPGTDSKSQEYIYFLCDELDKEFTGNENPVSWSTNQNYQTDDYPFIGTDGANVLNNDWTDNPQGLDETHRYEYISTRSYDTSNETWGAFSEPVIWANWGHSGEDGDGIEYIYYLCDEKNKQFDETNNPQYWTNDTDYQLSEYFRDNCGWTDNPQGVSDTNKYEYVSVRKYKNAIIQNLAESSQSNSNEFNINYTNYTAKWNPENMLPYKEFMSIEDIMDYTYEGTGKYVYLGSGIGENQEYDGRIDIRYAMAQCIHLLWTTKLTGLKNAYEMLYLLMAFYTVKQSTGTLTLDSFKYEAIKPHYNNTNNNYPDKIPSDRYINIINILVSGESDQNYQETYNLLSNIWDNFNDAGFKISDFSRNIGLQIVINRIKFNSTFIKKQWHPYSSPALWSSYGTPGAPGAPGGSGLTIDFDNPSMQIAVNSTGYIKDNQTVTTYLNLYEGTQYINNQYVTLSINDGPDAFTHSYVSSDKFGYTLHNSGNYTYYTWTIGNIDTGDDGTIDSNESPSYSNILKLENNVQLSFNISYNGNNYTKNINLVPIQYGKDGANAETFELHCAYSTIHYNRMLDTPALEPSSVQYKIKHTSKNGVDFITLPNDNFTNFTISYSLVYENDNVTSGREGSSGRTLSSSVTTNNGTTNNGIINIPSNNLNTLTQVNVQLKHDSNVWDEDILEVVYDGVNGVDGDGTEYIYYRSQEPIEWVAYVSGSNDDNNVNPSYWTPNGENGSSDYIPTPYKNILWFDHPQGVDSSYVWEYVSQRQYNGLKNTWERYTSPITWSHYGETGRDGDGIEYIFCLCDNPVFDGESPELWVDYNDYQESEYIPTKPGNIASDMWWDDDPHGVSEDHPYEFVSVRKYKTVTQGDNMNTIGHEVGTKVWFPYSAPKLWAKYGKDGKASAITMDNDNENIAVLLDGQSKIKTDVNEISYINMYDNLNPVSFTLVAPSSGFSHATTNSAKNNPGAYWYVGDNDANNPCAYAVRFKYNANHNFEGRTTYHFDGKYVKNGTTYSRGTNVTIIGIREADVPTLYQLRPTAKVVKWDGGSTYTPDNIYSYVSYIENGENRIITSYDSGLFNNDKLKLYVNNKIQSSLSYTISSTSAKTFPLNVELKYGSNNILLDSETITLVSDGKKGDPGIPGADAITLDFTNDQINLAVDGDGYIKPNQEKTTYLYIYPSNVEIDNIEISYDTNKINVINGNNSNSGKINLTYSKDTNIAKYTININILSGINVQIPENGLNIEFDISLNDGSELWKTLKICGQHNGEDGENAVTYELNPDYNIIKYDGTNFRPKSRFGISLIKYDGENISTLSYNDWHNSMLVSYYFDNNTTNTQTYNGTNISLIDNVNDSLSIMLHNGTDIEDDIIDTETIPIIYDGEDGTQGFTGPVVRMRGEYVHNSNTQYGNGEYNRSTNGNQYNGTSPLYIDIVTYTNNNGTKYYTPKTNVSGSYMASDSSYLCKGSYFVSNTYPTTPSDSLNGKWKEATQFDFIATKLLYADQALINQISTHDLIATKQNGYPVAGITSGSKVIKDKEGNDILSPLNPSNSNNPISSIITNSGSSDDPTLNSDGTDGSSVRIFAGEIKKGNSYSLTYAPFNVRQDGTAYMTNAVVKGDITANTLNLKKSTANTTGNTINESFVNITNADCGKEYYLPSLDTNVTRTIYVLCNLNSFTGTNPIIKTHGDGLIWGENPKSRVNNGNVNKFIHIQPNMLYQLIGMNNSGTQTWTVIEIPLSPVDSGTTIINNITNPEYYDVTADVTLIGYNYSNGGWYDMATSELPVPKIQYGSDNGNNYVSIDFYTYLSMDESLVNLNNGNNYDAYADLGKLFGWFS